jgi:hypothetical protein
MAGCGNHIKMQRAYAAEETPTTASHRPVQALARSAANQS